MRLSSRFSGFRFCSIFSFIALAASTTTGCASLRSVSVTSIPQNRNEPVVASVSKWIFLGLNFDNDYVDELTSKLRQKCDGKVSGLMTKYESTLYFILSKDQITATGYCVDSKRSRSAANSNQGAAK
ncbi:hypothetical protein EBR21_03445 [bacterium]|nr:hypothetical protein [bacterium]